MSALKATLSAVVAVWVGVPQMAQAMAVMVGLNLLTGLANPGHRLFDECKKACLSFLLVLGVHYLCSHTKLYFGFDVPAGLALYFSLGAFMQSLKNCKQAGVAIPEKLIELIERAEGATFTK